MLLYPDLRALEGVLKEHMAGYGMNTSNAENGFGEYFQPEKRAKVLKADYAEKVKHEGMIQAFNDAYSLLSKHRNSLFHMEELADGSRMVDTLEKAISLSKDTYQVMHKLYAAKK